MHIHIDNCRCLAVIEAGQWAHEGWMLSYNVDPKTQLVGTTLANSRVDRKYSQFHDSFTNNRDEMIVPFLVKRRELVKKVKAMLGGAAKGTSCLVMCANAGHVSLILNFVCNLRRKGIKLPLHVFFVTTKALQKQLTDWGFTAFYDTVFDMLPSQDAGAYGDGTFAKMMLLKV